MPPKKGKTKKKELKEEIKDEVENKEELENVDNEEEVEQKEEKERIKNLIEKRRIKREERRNEKIKNCIEGLDMTLKNTSLTTLINGEKKNLLRLFRERLLDRYLKEEDKNDTQSLTYAMYMVEWYKELTEFENLLREEHRGKNPMFYDDVD